MAPALRLGLRNRQFEPRVRGVAAEALRELNDYESADVAADVLADATDRDLLVSTLGLLAHVGRADQVTTIRRLLTAEEPIVRSRAMSVLGRIGTAGDMPTLEAALDDPSPWVALRAAEALLEAGSPVLERIAGTDHPRADLARQLLAGGSA